MPLPSRPSPLPPPDDRAAWRARYDSVRENTMALAAPLSAEDQQVQSMPDASPTKWHLAHTSWFFETFVLSPHAAGYAPFHPDYGYLFNSYYEAVGARHPRPERGLLTRPALADIHRYRAHADGAMARFIESAPDALWREVAPLVELGLHHEEQHQELILMDVKHLFSMNPLKPAYRPYAPHEARSAAPMGWESFEGGLYEIGHDGTGFAFDNEGPRHKVWLEPFQLADRLVTNAEYCAFIEDGGYERPELWLADGWAAARAEGWTAPLYWRRAEEGWRVFALAGEQPMNSVEPVSHVSYYEADAYARWAGRRLAREAEWEVAAARLPEGARAAGNFRERGALHPLPARPEPGLRQMFGDLWEWTQSPYAPYPGFKPAAGAVGEYNGKFMSGQMALRGGAAVTPAAHIRATYRNFFPPGARWAFSGIRLADDA
ncbi:MAG: ergothioneine biosynthesis protein EgtB [Amphiplicatus sp.]